MKIKVCPMDAIVSDVTLSQWVCKYFVKRETEGAIHLSPRWGLDEMCVPKSGLQTPPTRGKKRLMPKTLHTLHI